MAGIGYAGGVTPPHCSKGSGTVVFSDMRALPGLLG
jgi:hypothetical protein